MGRVLFCLHRDARPHIPDDEVRRLCLSIRCLLSLSRVRPRVYALTEASKYVLFASGILITSSLGTGLWFVSVPSGRGPTLVQLQIWSSNLPLQPSKCPIFHSTRSERVPSLPPTITSGPTGHRLCSPVFIADRLSDTQKSDIATDVVAFVCLIVFIFKHKADRGQSRMTRLVRTIFHDGILYFFVMVWFHVGMFFNVQHRVIPPHSLVNRCILTS